MCQPRSCLLYTKSTECTPRKLESVIQTQWRGTAAELLKGQEIAPDCSLFETTRFNICVGMILQTHTHTRDREIESVHLGEYGESKNI